MKYNVGGFDFYEQQIEDVLRIIDIIKPMVGIIRESYGVSENLQEIHERGIEANGKIEAYSEILSLDPSEAITQKLESEIKSLNTFVEEGIQEFEEIDDYLTDVEVDLSEYSKYIQSINWINLHIVIEVMSRISSEDNMAIIAALLLFTNESIEEEREDIFNYLIDIIEDEEIKNVLRLTSIDENALIEYISTTDLLEE